MKTTGKLFTGLLVFLISYSYGFGQEVDDIIEKHIKAHGGLENWEKVNTLKITGNYTSFSETKKFTTLKARPNKYYSDYFSGMHRIKEAYNGKTAWTINPWFDLSFARKTNSAETNVLKQKSEFCTPFFNYKEKGYKVEFHGKEELEGIDVLKLELTKPDNQVETWYLDAKTYLEYISTSTWEDFGSPTTQETFYSEFTKTGNLILPFYIETTFPTRLRVTEIEKVEINTKIDTNIFNIPLSDEMQKLKILEGNWDVTYDALNRRGTWYTVDKTTSDIKFSRNLNILEEKISYVQYFPIQQIKNITYNTNTEKYRLTYFNDFYSNINIYEGKFEGDSIIFDNKNISFSIEEPNKDYRKYIYKDISKEGFILEILASDDKGETWQIRHKFTYTGK